jgi:hypothetical protein
MLKTGYYRLHKFFIIKLGVFVYVHVHVSAEKFAFNEVEVEVVFFLSRNAMGWR